MLYSEKFRFSRWVNMSPYLYVGRWLEYSGGPSKRKGISGESMSWMQPLFLG